jgi:hypothetical protein
MRAERGLSGRWCPGAGLRRQPDPGQGVPAQVCNLPDDPGNAGSLRLGPSVRQCHLARQVFGASVSNIGYAGAPAARDHRDNPRRDPRHLACRHGSRRDLRNARDVPIAGLIAMAVCGSWPGALGAASVAQPPRPPAAAAQRRHLAGPQTPASRPGASSRAASVVPGAVVAWLVTDSADPGKRSWSSQAHQQANS